MATEPIFGDGGDRRRRRLVPSPREKNGGKIEKQAAKAAIIH
jgi:hypothetical protein